MMLFVQRAEKWLLVHAQESQVVKQKLDPGVYLLNQTPMGELFLTEEKPFVMPKKIYGGVKKQTERILNTYFNQTSSLGVLLTGLKGSGKTLLAKKICVEAGEKGIPTILINDNFESSALIKFITSFPMDAIFLFDEFEKVLPEEKDQAPLLTLLGGVYNTHQIFIFTSNKLYSVNDNFLNRPERIRYALQYDSLKKKEIREYIEDVLKDKRHAESVMRVCHALAPINFDMLQTLVNEMNLYNEGPAEALELLNIKSYKNDEQHIIKTFVVNGENKLPDVCDRSLFGIPLIHKVIKVSIFNDEEDEEKTRICFEFYQKHLTSIDHDLSVYYYDNGVVKMSLHKTQEWEKTDMSEIEQLSIE